MVGGRQARVPSMLPPPGDAERPLTVPPLATKTTKPAKKSKTPPAAKKVPAAKPAAPKLAKKTKKKGAR